MADNSMARGVMTTRKTMMSVSGFRKTVRDDHALQLLMEDYPRHPELYIRTFMLRINGKHRKIVTYQSDEFGNALRKIHHMLAYAVRRIYTSHENSFAYKENVGVLSALEKHLDSHVFLKTDIHAYFDSVEPGKMLECIFRRRPTLEKERKFWGKALAVCFYEGRLPIGFVSSPILSDLYLNDLDVQFSTISGVQYTRYADDIIFSSNTKDAEEKLSKLQEELKDFLAPLHLELNKKKTYIRTLKQEGDAIHLLGLNLVQTGKGNNRITVSDSYIRKTSMEFCELLQEKDQLDDLERRERFCQVNGKIGYIRHASAQSTEKLRKMIRIKAGVDTDLSQKSLTELLMSEKAYLLSDEWKPKEYQATNMIPRDLPTAGHVWEKACIPENGERREIAALRYYLNNFCLDIESGNWDLKIIRVSLTIGEDTKEMLKVADIPAFRDHVFRLRKTKEKVNYSAEYRYRGKTNPDGSLRYKLEHCHLPVFIYGRVHGNGVIWDEEKDKWGTIVPCREATNIPEDKKELDRLVNVIIPAHNNWQGSFSMEMRWPQNAGIEKHERILKICAAIAGIPGIKDAEENVGMRLFTCVAEEKLPASSLQMLIRTLAELNEARWDAEGRLKANGRYTNAGYPENSQSIVYRSVTIIGKPTLQMNIEVKKFEI